MPSLVRRLLDRPITGQSLVGLTHSGPSYEPVPLPRRGDHVDLWLQALRGDHVHDPVAFNLLDQVLDQYRLHADTRTPLHEHCCEGGNVDDCAGCHDAKTTAGDG
jgi:hypothetical protein